MKASVLARWATVIRKRNRITCNAPGLETLFVLKIYWKVSLKYCTFLLQRGIGTIKIPFYSSQLKVIHMLGARKGPKGTGNNVYPESILKLF